MSILRKFFASAIGLLVACVFTYGLWRIVSAKPPETQSNKSAPAATTTKVSEDDLGTVKLTAEAEHRLGIEVATVIKRRVRRVRTFGGEVTVPVGRTILIAAPLGGTLQAPAGGAPLAGQSVIKGQHVLTLLPLFSPEASTTLATSRADVEGQVKNAETQLAAAKLALDRAQRLFGNEAGSKRSVEETQAQHDLALRTLEAAQSRLAIIAKALGAAETGHSSPIAIESPENGILRNVAALPGQNVPNGGALFEVVDLSMVWVRVPVYVGDLSSIDLTLPVAVGDLDGRPGEKTWEAVLSAAPPSANPISATVDLVFAMPNEEAKLTPGQRVGVAIPLTQAGESLTLPWGAIVHDIHGGTWIYEAVGPRTYKRERVIVRYIVDGEAVLAEGLAPGAKVVAAGAIELFGAETGFSK